MSTNKLTTAAVIAVVAVLFTACNKESEQPVQNIAIHTFIEIEGVDYPVTGNAMAGNDSGK